MVAPKAAPKAAQVKLPWDDVAPLSTGEATALRENVIEGMKAFWQGTDQVISFSNKNKREAYIWQSIDDEDTGFLADRLLMMATRNKAIAAGVRGVAASSALLRTGAILLPRFMQTVQFYSDNGGLYIGGFK